MVTDTGSFTAPGGQTSLIPFSVTTPPLLEVMLYICLGFLCRYESVCSKLSSVLNGVEKMSVYNIDIGVSYQGNFCVVSGVKRKTTFLSTESIKSIGYRREFRARDLYGRQFI